MRFALLSFLPLLLLPSLVASKGYSPPPHQMPSHGDFVTYPHSGATHTGIVVGTEHQVFAGHPLHVAPLAHHSAPPPGNVVAHTDQLIQMRPGHAAGTGHSDVTFASNLAREHNGNPPRITRRRVYSWIT